MEKLKSDILHLPIREQLALAAWLTNLIKTEAEATLKDGEPLPQNWMWNVAEQEYDTHLKANEPGVAWEDLKMKHNKK